MSRQGSVSSLSTAVWAAESFSQSRMTSFSVLHTLSRFDLVSTNKGKIFKGNVLSLILSQTSAFGTIVCKSQQAFDTAKLSLSRPSIQPWKWNQKKVVQLKQEVGTRTAARGL